MAAKSSSKFAARMVDAEYQDFIREKGQPNETFVSPFTGATEVNKVTISVKALNDLRRALRGEDTLRAMKRNAQKGGA